MTKKKPVTISSFFRHAQAALYFSHRLCVLWDLEAKGAPVGEQLIALRGVVLLPACARVGRPKVREAF